MEPVMLRQTVDMGTAVQLSLPMAEVVVLSHIVSRFTDGLELLQLDEAERQVLWNLECVLEKLDPMLFSEDHDACLRQAKNYLTGSENDVRRST